MTPRNRISGEFPAALDDGRSVPRSLLDMAENGLESIDHLRRRAVADLAEARKLHGRGSPEEFDSLEKVCRAQRVLGVIEKFTADLAEVLYHETTEVPK